MYLQTIEPAEAEGEVASIYGILIGKSRFRDKIDHGGGNYGATETSSLINRSYFPNRQMA